MHSSSEKIAGLLYFHDFSVKNYLILYAKQKKSESESSVSFLKQSRGLKASAAQFYPDLPWVPPPPRALLYPPCRMMQLVSQKIVYIVIYFFF